jgi:hypothetical protein
MPDKFQPIDFGDANPVLYVRHLEVTWMVTIIIDEKYGRNLTKPPHVDIPFKGGFADTYVLYPFSADFYLPHTYSAASIETLKVESINSSNDCSITISVDVKAKKLNKQVLAKANSATPFMITVADSSTRVIFQGVITNNL